MKNILKNRKFLIVGIFLLALISISVGYAFITQRLNINGNATISKTTWNIHFDEKYEYSCNTDTIKTLSYSDNDTKQIIEVNPLFKNHDDVYDFIVELKNEGTVDAYISSIVETGNEENELVFSYTYVNYKSDNLLVPVQVNDPLYAGTTKLIRIMISLNEHGQEYITKEEKEYNLKLELTFAQLDEGKTTNEYVENTLFNLNEYTENISCNPNPDEKHLLHIDPNGGEYDGHTEEFTIELWKGQTYSLLTPTHETEYNGEVPINYVHSWEITPSLPSISSNKVKMEHDDIYAKVIWSEMDAVAKINRIVENNGVQTIQTIYYPTIREAFDDAKVGLDGVGETIILLRDTVESPLNKNLEDIKLNLHGHKVTGMLQNNGRLTLINEKEDASEESEPENAWFINENGIGMINNGTFTLGIKDEDIDKDNIGIYGSSENGGIGLKNNGTFNFYDGYLDGFIGLDGIYNDVPELYRGEAKDIYAIVDHNATRDCQHVYVGPQPDLVVAKTEENGCIKFYFELPQAFNYATSQREKYENPLVVTAVAEFPATYEIIINEDEEQVFDLAGYKVSPGAPITNYGKLTIKDSSVEPGLLTPSETIKNVGELIVDNVNITATADKDVILNNGKIEIVRSTIKANEGYAVNIASGTEMILDSDTYLKADSYALYCNTRKDFILQGGNIEGIYNNGNLVIKEGTNIKKMTFGDTTYGIHNTGAVSKLTLDHLNLDITNAGARTYAVYCDDDASQVIIDGGNITVNSTYEGSGSLEDTIGATVIVNGTITVKDGVLKASTPNGVARTIYSPRSLVIENGELKAEGKYTANVASGSATIRGGKLTSEGTEDSYTFYNYQTSGQSVLIDDGVTIENEGICALMHTGNVTVNGGTINCSKLVEGSTYYYNGSNFGSVNINGGTLNLTDKAIYGHGTVNVRGGNTTSQKTTIDLNYNSTVNVSGGYLTSIDEYGIYSNSSGTKINVTNENSIPVIKGYKTGIMLQSGELKFDSGEAIGETEYGVYLNGNATLGVNDGVVDNDLNPYPHIIGNFYGLYIEPNKYVDMYDGILHGKTKGYAGNITGTEDGYAIDEFSEKTINGIVYNECKLDKEEDYVRIGDVYFDSLQKAINYVHDNDLHESEDLDATIVVLKNYSIRNSVTAPAGKKIALDFDGYVFKMTQPFKNYGTFIFTNLNEERIGGIQAPVTKVINNYGTMIFEKGDYTSSYGTFVYNNGDLILNDAKLYSNGPSDIMITVYNETTRDKVSSFTMNGGLVETHGTGTYVYGIYNVAYYESRSQLHFNDGQIKVYGTYSTREYLTESYGAVGVYGGSIEIDNANIYANNESGNAHIFHNVDSLIINGGVYKVDANRASVVTSSNLTMNGGKLDANGTVDSYDTYYSNTTINNDSELISKHTCIAGGSHTTNINGGTLTCLAYGIKGTQYNNTDNFGTINITDGNIVATEDGISGAGIINITGGTLTSTQKGINLNHDSRGNKSIVLINGGTIKSLNNYGIYSNNNQNEITIGENSEVTIGSEPYIEGTTGAYLNAGKINIDKASIVGKTEYGVYSGATTFFGVDETRLEEPKEMDLSNTYPMIKGEVEGLYIVPGTVTNINDGIFKSVKTGTDDIAYDGFISGFPDAYTIITGSEEIDGKTYVTNYLQEQEYFLRVGTTQYNSLQRAIDAIDESDTIYVIADHVMKTETEIPEGKDITLNFQGHTLLFSKRLRNYGKLTINDANNRGGISTSQLSPLSEIIQNYNELIINGGNYNGLTEDVIYNSGTMIMNDGYIKNESTSETTIGIKNESTSKGVASFVINGGEIIVNSNNLYTYGIYNINFAEGNNRYIATTEINNATIKVTSTLNRAYSSDGIYVINDGDVTFNSGNIIATGTNTIARGISGASKVIMNGGTIESEGNAAYGISSSNVVMNHGIITTNGSSSAYGLNVSGTSEVNNDSEITSNKACVYNSSTFTLNNGTLICGTNGIEGGTAWYEYSYINVNGGTITAENLGINARSTVNYAGGTTTAKANGINLTTTNCVLNMTGGTIISTEQNGIYMTDSSSTFQIGKNETSSSSPYVVGAIQGANIIQSTTTLGNKDGNVLNDSFTIQGGTYGLYNEEGPTYFYDGTLKGTTYGYLIMPVELEEGTFIYEDAEEIEGVNYIVNYLLEEKEVVENVRTAVQYKSLQRAISEAENNDTLRLIANVQLYYQTEVPEGKIVTLDFNNHTMTATRMIINNGNLTILDSSKQYNSYESTAQNINLIQNSGTLTINDISFSNVLNRNNAVINNLVGGVLTINNTKKVDAENPNEVTEKVEITGQNGIYNSGVLELNYVDVTVTNTAINDHGIMTINGGEINGESKAIYSYTNGEGEINGSNLTSTSNPLYKASGSGTLTLNDTNMLVGSVYNLSGTLNINNGTINNYFENRATTTVNGTIMTDESYCSYVDSCSYTSITNTGTLSMNNVTYNMTSGNGGDFTMLNNSGTFNSDNSTYETNRTINYQRCYYGSCWGFYVRNINNTGNINTKDSIYTLKDTSSAAIPVTYYYGISTSGSGTIKTDGDTLNIPKGTMAYGILSTLSSTENEIKNTNINVENARTQYGINTETGTYTITDTNIKLTGATNAYGVYLKTGNIAMLTSDTEEITGSVDVSASRIAYGLYIDRTGSELTLGAKETDESKIGTENARVLTKNAMIKAISPELGVGVKKVNGRFNYYDGEIIGSTNAKPDTETLAETNYVAFNFYDEEKDYVSCHLIYRGQSESTMTDRIARIGNTYYKTLNDAFNKAKTGDVVTLVKATAEENVENNNRNAISLDLNGYILSGTITNNGNLTIINNGKVNGTPVSGQINGGDNPAIINNNRLFIGVNDTDISQDNILILSDNVAVQNNGAITMYDGYIKAYKALRGNPIVTAMYCKVTKSLVTENEETKEAIYIEATTDVTEAEFPYDYTGGEQTFVAPEDGTYKIEAWGAEGGYGYQDGNSAGTPGYGAYVTGIIQMEAGDKLYINVGGEGTDGTTGLDSNGGYNGGGKGTHTDEISSGGGGGATSITTSSGLLSEFYDKQEDIVIVAGGGGGASTTIAGSGGGINGGYNANTNNSYPTQISGYQFGLGESGTSDYAQAGAGGGYFGGYANKRTSNTSGTGGSGYIGYEELEDKFMTCYSCTSSNEVNTKTYSTTKHDSNPTSSYTKEGNGYVLIKKLTNLNYISELVYSSGTLKDKDGISETVFSSNEYEYRLDVDKNTQYIDLTGITADPAVTVNKYTHYHLEMGNNNLVLKTRDQDGIEKEYKINVYRTPLEEGVHSAEINVLEFDDTKINPSKFYVEEEHEFDIYIISGVETIEPIITFYDATATFTVENNTVNELGNGTFTITTHAENCTDIVYTVNYKIKEQLFDYTGEIEEYTVPKTGIYKLEAWGASGSADNGGFGGYTVSEVYLHDGDKLYIAVGGRGTTGAGDSAYGGPVGGYNGGGSGGNSSSGSGGGATHIAFKSGLLKDLEEDKNSIILVAGGGGGSTNGGAGGGYIGAPAKISGLPINNSQFIASPERNGGSGMGATQKNGFAFGEGESVTYNDTVYGAGGGYYGGYVTNNSNGGAGGGSGYFMPSSFNSKMVCYNCAISNEKLTKTETTTSYNATPTSNTPKVGNGYAKITYEREASDNNYLDSLSYSTGTLYDASGDNRIRFDKKTQEYMIKVDMYTTSITLDYIPENENSTVTGEKEIELNTGDNRKEIVVTAEDGSTRIYKVNIKREVDPVLKTSIKKIKFNENSIKDIEPKAYEYQYDINVFCKITSLNIELELYSDDVTYEIEGADRIYEDGGVIKITVTDVTGTKESVYQLYYTNTCSFDYDYTGDYQIFTAPADGFYKMETWGAQGGDRGGSSKGGKGGYTTGSIYLLKDQTLYVYVGGSGNTGGTSGGFNGGGGRDTYNGGGGATDIRTEVGNLYTRFIVAGGGGSTGGTYNEPGSDYSGGYGGGLEGGRGINTFYPNYGTGNGGTQTSGGADNGTFGQGGYSTKNNTESAGAGGGGWYGGGAGSTYTSGSYNRGGGGGSSFALTAESFTNVPNLYELNADYYLIDTTLVSGNEEMPNPYDENMIVGKENNGYARITYVNENVITKDDIMIKYYLDEEEVNIMPDKTKYYDRSECNNDAIIMFNENLWDYIIHNISSRETVCKIYFKSTKGDFAYTGEVEEYVVPKSGYYKLEVWGAQGGDRGGSSKGGKGGYTSGEIYLFEGTKLYIYVGGSGNTGGTSGGFNGGGGRDTYNGGGGATDIRTEVGNLYTRFIVAGGGGSVGGTQDETRYDYSGGYGGGFEGGRGINTNYSNNGRGLGGTQTSGGADNGTFGQGGYSTKINTESAGAGGGGWYGGGAGSTYTSSSYNRGGGGGSSFALTAESIENVPVGYNVSSKYYLNNVKLIAGNEAQPSYLNHLKTVTGKQGDGFARITLIEGNDNNYMDILSYSTYDSTETINIEPGIEEYEFEVQYYDNQITIDGEKFSDYSTINGLGLYYLEFGENIINISVTAKNGDVRVYKLNITRPYNSNSTLIDKISFDLAEINDIYPDKDKYDYNVNYALPQGTTSLNMDIKLQSNESTYTIVGNTNLTGEDGIILIKVSNPNSGDSTYSISYIFNSLSEDTNFEQGKVINFEYTGSEQVYIAPESGYYKLEAWGAQGGSANDTYIGGYGGYSTGIIHLTRGETLYINVGGQGKQNWTSNTEGGYNGGGSTYETRSQTYEGTGGGATHIATTSGLLASLENDQDKIIIVAGGGGGGSYYTGGGYSGSGGSGGGYKGADGGKNENEQVWGKGATQTAGGAAAWYSNYNSPEVNGTFGQGGINNGLKSQTWGQAGGGGGYYGGGLGHHSGAGGGSGYIGSYRLQSNNIYQKKMYGYNVEESYDEDTYTISTTEYSIDAESEKAKAGNGHVRLTSLVNPSNSSLSYINIETANTNRNYYLNNENLEYTIIVDKYDYKINISNELTDNYQSISGLGEYELNQKENIVNITSTSLNGDVTIYKFTIIKDYDLETDAEIEYIDFNNEGISKLYFEKNVYKYSLLIPIGNQSLDLNIKTFSNNATCIVNGNEELDDTGSITINVINGNNSKTYIIDYYLIINADNYIFEDVSSKSFEYIGESEEYIIPQTGFYMLETWGAQGADRDASHYGGYGAYSTGIIFLEKDTVLYVTVGEQGRYDDSQADIYNGGGNSGSSGGGGSGGGATHIAKVSGELKDLSDYKGELSESGDYYISEDILMVSGAGAGFASWGCSTSIGGSGGGKIGSGGRGGTQISGGVSYGQTSGTFGYAGRQSNYGSSTPGAGSGFFGGGTGSNYCTASGGSGYIANPNLGQKKMVMYATDTSFISDDRETKTEITTNVSDEAIANYAKKGAGAAKITYLKIVGKVD